MPLVESTPHKMYVHLGRVFNVILIGEGQPLWHFIFTTFLNNGACL